MLVSALSQMWAFALYELLRTWRERIRGLRKQRENGMLIRHAERLEREAEKSHNIASLIRGAQARRVLDNPAVLALADGHLAAIQPAFGMLELLRINLAKHEAPGKSNVVPGVPGYARINAHCGALDFELVAGDRTTRVLNRRDIADQLRRTVVPAEVEPAG